MKVLVVTPYYYPATCFGGPVWVTKDLSEGMAKKGIDVQVLATAANQPIDDVPRVERMHEVTISYEKRLGNSPWFFSPALGRRAFELAPRFDILHVHGIWAYPNAIGCIAARERRKPYILVPHGCFDPWALAHKKYKKIPYFSLIEKRNIRLADAVHCLTQREADQVRALVPEARCEVIPNAATIDPADLTETGKQAFSARFPTMEGKRVVLFLSRIHQKKGLDLLIPAFAKVAARFSDAHLAIAGPDEGGYRATVESLISKHGIDNAVTFTGLLNGQDKLAAFDRAEVFVLPSHSEGLPVVVLEAMAFGKPVVITDPCNLTDEVRGNGAGLVVDTTVESLAAGIESVLANPVQAKAMGEAGRKLAIDKFSLESVSGALIRLFQETIEKKTGATT